MPKNGIHSAGSGFWANPAYTGQKSGSISSASPSQSPLRHLQERWKYLSAQECFQRAPLLTASRLLSWRVRCLLRKPAIVNFPEWSVRMYLPPEWRGIAKLVFAFRENYEAELACLREILSPGSVFVDAGANIGIYSLAASKLVGETGQVLAFEPSAQSFPVLERNIALNRLTNVRAFPSALAQDTGRAWLHRGPNSSLNSLGKDPSWEEGGEAVVTETLDKVLNQPGIRRVDVIKMDVQGAEELVLRGACKTIASERPVIIFEVWPDGALLLGLSPTGSWELLESSGYEFFAVGRGAQLSAIKSPPAIGNVVGIHREMKDKRPFRVMRTPCTP
jgi:FkbM family methyltransferase